MDRQIYFFMHQMKCGGSTLHFALSQLFKDAHVFDINGYHYHEEGLQYLKFDPQRKADYDLVKGHMFYGIHQGLPNFTYFSLFREPLSRLLSLYNFAYREENLQYHHQLKQNQPDFVNFVLDGYAKNSDNGMTRFVAGVDWDEVPYGKLDEDAFNKAIHHIDQDFCMVGITEEFDKSLLLLQKILGTPNHPFYIFQNVTANIQNGHSTEQLTKHHIKDHQLTLIEDYIKWDLRLYDYVKSKYEDLMVIHFPDNADNELERFKTNNSRFQKRWLMLNKFKQFRPKWLS